MLNSSLFNLIVSLYRDKVLSPNGGEPFSNTMIIQFSGIYMRYYWKQANTILIILQVNVAFSFNAIEGL